MDKSNINYLGIIGCAILYAVTSFASAFTGFLNPWCWAVVFPALAAILGAPSYLWAASKWQRFGVATLFSLVISLLLLSTGEINLAQTAVMVGAGVISDIVRLIIGNNLRRGVLFAYPVLSLCIIAWIMKLWTAPEWYYQGAVEEMGQDYAEGLKPLSSLWVLAIVVALTIAVGFIAIRISAARMKSGEKLA